MVNRRSKRSQSESHLRAPALAGLVTSHPYLAQSLLRLSEVPCSSVRTAKSHENEKYFDAANQQEKSSRLLANGASGFSHYYSRRDEYRGNHAGSYAECPHS